LGHHFDGKGRFSRSSNICWLRICKSLKNIENEGAFPLDLLKFGGFDGQKCQIKKKNYFVFWLKFAVFASIVSKLTKPRQQGMRHETCIESVAGRCAGVANLFCGRFTQTFSEV
jgi:hypothetical protein